MTKEQTKETTDILADYIMKTQSYVDSEEEYKDNIRCTIGILIMTISWHNPNILVSFLKDAFMSVIEFYFDVISERD